MDAGRVGEFLGEVNLDLSDPSLGLTISEDPLVSSFCVPLCDCKASTKLFAPSYFKNKMVDLHRSHLRKRETARRDRSTMAQLTVANTDDLEGSREVITFCVAILLAYMGLTILFYSYVFEKFTILESVYFGGKLAADSDCTTVTLYYTHFTKVLKYYSNTTHFFPP